MFIEFLIFLISISVVYSDRNDFTCQTGPNAANCNLGVQYMSAGGHVSVRVKSANNLPNSAPEMGNVGVGNPFVLFRAGNLEAHSHAARNDNINPVWNEDVSIGVMQSGSSFTIEIYESNSGPGFDNVLIKSVKFAVPFCSTFMATEQTKLCDTPFGCKSYDSLWSMPTRKVCTESGGIPLGSYTRCVQLNGKVNSCLFVDINIVPAQVEIPLVYGWSQPVLGAAGSLNSLVSFSVTNEFSQPFLEDVSGNTLILSGLGQYPEYLLGSLLIRTPDLDKDTGNFNSVVFYALVNFPATIYVCRSTADNDIGIPTWLDSDKGSAWDKTNVSSTVFNLFSHDTSSVFGCFFLKHPGTIRNKYGGVIHNPIAFRSNTVKHATTYFHNYFVVVQPELIVTPPLNIEVIYDASLFMNSCGAYGLIFAWFLFLIARLLKRINYKLEHLMTFVMTRSLTGEGKSLLATLFLNMNKSQCNIEVRSHLYHTMNAFYLLIALPFMLLFAWGVFCINTLRPMALGYAVFFLGNAGLLMWFGFRAWEKNNWRMTPVVLFCESFSFALVLIFIFCVIFVEPAVTVYEQDINFPALSLLFGTFNVMPLFIIVFQEDNTYKRHMSKLMELMSDAAYQVKEGASKRKATAGPLLSVNKAMHVLLGDGYNINPKFPLLRFAAALGEPPKVNKPVNTEHSTGTVEEATQNTAPADKSEPEEVEQPYAYRIALFILFVYLMIVVNNLPNYSSMAFLNCLTLIFLDFLLSAVSAGEIRWSPFFKICLIVSGRIIIMFSRESNWVLCYSVVYLIYAFALMGEVISTMLPMLTKRQAGDVVFSGVEEKVETNYDISGTPYFCLGLLTLMYVGLMLISKMGSVASLKLPTPQVDLFGQSWFGHVFVVVALVILVTGSLMIAVVRAFYLEKNGLLRGWARESFMIKRVINVPVILSLFTEISILLGGLLVYGLTDSTLVLILCIFLPPIFMCFGYAYKVWVANDFDLVVWPPVDSADNLKNSSPNDLEVALHMIDEVFAVEDLEPETDVPQERVLKGFKLPKMEVAGKNLESQVKMPPLPLKSVLRRKRETMNVKTKAPLSKDLIAAREGAVDDKFGSSENDNLLDRDDPWNITEYDNDDVKEVKQAAPKKVREVKERGGFANNPYWLDFKEFIFNSAPYLLWKKYYDMITEYITKRRAAYAKIGSELDGDAAEGEVNPDAVVPFDEDFVKNKKANKELFDDMDEEEEPEKKEEEGPIHENLSKMAFRDAVIGGYLTKAEYGALLSFWGGMFLVFVMGCVISAEVNPSYMGHVFWMFFFVVMFTFLPLYKYFHTYVIDDSVKLLMECAFVSYFVFFLVWFSVFLNSNVTIGRGIWVLMFFIYYPVFMYVIWELLKWRDGGYVAKHVKVEEYTFLELVELFRIYPILVVLFCFLTAFVYSWLSELGGVLCVLALLMGMVAFPFVYDWSSNDFFLSPQMTFIFDILIKTTLFFSLIIAAFQPNTNPLMSLSVFFFVYIFKCLLNVASRFMLADVDTLLYFSPFLLPIYSYDPSKHDLVDESPAFKQALYALIAAVLWGCSMAMFLYPVDVGVCVACFFLLVVAGIVVAAVSFVPMQLGKCVNMIGVDVIKQAASEASKKFENRKFPLDFNIGDWETNSSNDGLNEWRDITKKEALVAIAKVEREALASGLSAKEARAKAALQDGPRKTIFELDIMKSSIGLGMEIIDNTRALSYVRDEGDGVGLEIIAEKEEKPAWYRRYWSLMTAEVKKFFNIVGVKKEWKLHSECMFQWSDVIAEAVLTGRGSFGFMGLEGQWYNLFQYAQNQPNLGFLRQPWLNVYDSVGNNRTYTLLSERLDSVGVLNRIVQLDNSLDYVYKEETRCSVHFLLLIMVAANAKMQREQVLFQKFLRENRYRLSSNGISPPANIFKSSSFASIDIQLVAVWLSTLSEDERERFHLLKRNFSSEQIEKDSAIDEEDQEILASANELKDEREDREKEMADRINHEMIRVQYERVQNFVESLHPVEQNKFMAKKDIWLANADCIVSPEDEELHKKFKEACMQDKEESLGYARNALASLEAAQRDCRIGEYGRNYQFVDGEFLPGDTCLGTLELSNQVMGWRCAPGIADHAQLFDITIGTNANEIREGIFADEWLLSAICMLITADASDAEKISSRISKLFVMHYTPDGELTFNTDVGAYCVRLHKRGIWTPIIIDDIFPLLKNSNWTSENRGLSTSFCKEVTSIWVPLIEKAYAKYYGDYSMLAKGFVQHALEDLTGCETECVLLANISRGTGKLSLWDNMVRYCKNGYILGAGTGSMRYADKEMLDMGLVFQSSYSIYEVRSIDGYQLVKLRNPPGDHETWKGDWGSTRDKLWNKRLKYKLKFDEEDKASFWISFDDFCDVFRYLYVCRWNDETKWISATLPGFWKKPTELAEELQIRKQQLLAEDEDDEDIREEMLKIKREEAVANMDTSGGLPSKHNPGCILENNPHYSLKIHCPTEVKICVTQTDSRGNAQEIVLPFAFYVIECHESQVMRINSIQKDDVVVYTGVPKASRVQTIYVTLNPGLYTIIVCAYMKGMEGNFSLSVSSNSIVDLQPVWPRKWMIANADLGGDDFVAAKADEMVNYLRKGMTLLFGEAGQAEAAPT